MIILTGSIFLLPVALSNSTTLLLVAGLIAGA
jgi:hypothetical protein